MRLQDEEEKAYLAYSSKGNKVLHLRPLAPDYLTPLPPYQRLFPGQAREAPAIFKSGDLYLMFTSGAMTVYTALCQAAGANQGSMALSMHVQGCCGQRELLLIFVSFRKHGRCQQLQLWGPASGCWHHGRAC